MALSRPLFVGFSSASKVARDGGDLEVTVQTAAGPCVFTLPWFFVRDVDALLERWRREEHEARLLIINNGFLGATLVEAAEAGGLRDVTFLVARGADVNYRFMNRTALEMASFRGHVAVVTVLLDAGALGLEVDAALLEAARRGQTLFVALLLDRGADVHYTNDWPLQEAAFYGRVETLLFLLERGADIHADNERALRMAREGGHEAVIALLLERGAVDLPEDD